jgi:hypothetical protein
VSQASQHDRHQSHGDASLFTAGEHLIIEGSPAPCRKPGQRALHDVTPLEDMEAAGPDLLPINDRIGWRAQTLRRPLHGCSTISTSQPSVALTHEHLPSFLYPLSAQTSSRRGKTPLSGARKSLPPRESWMVAAWTRTCRISPRGSTSRWRLRPFTFFPPS